ncbi:MAG: hypothetical protein NVSMB45_13550 [Ginsengibacter sp.]
MAKKEFLERICVKPLCIRELSLIYGVSYKTMTLWLRDLRAEIGFKRGRYFTVKQVGIIFQNLGVPYVWDE